MNQLKYSDIAAELRETSKVCLNTMGSYAYATGTYESILANLVADLPKHKQVEVMRILKSTQKSLKEKT